MIETQLVPPGTKITAKGDGPAVDISAASARVFLVTFTIEQVVEQESIDLSVWGSADGTNWGTKALAWFPQKFYAGKQPLLVDLSGNPEIKFLRAHWEVNRWGRGSEIPMFVIHVELREVPREMLSGSPAPAMSAR